MILGFVTVLLLDLLVVQQRSFIFPVFIKSLEARIFIVELPLISLFYWATLRIILAISDTVNEWNQP